MIKKQIVKNFISAWFSKIVKLASAIYLVPLFIQHMGKDAYGLIVLLTTMLSFAYLADMGIRSGVTRYMTRAISLNQHDEFNKVLNTGLVMYFMVWLVLATALFFSTDALIGLFNVPVQYQSDCRLLLRTYGILSLFWTFTTPLFGAVSSATNRYDISNYRESIIGTISIVVLILAIQFFNIGILGWAVITIFTQIITAIVMIRVAVYLAPYLRVSFHYFDSKKIKDLLKFGGVTFIGAWSRRMKIDADPLLISSVLNPAFVSVYRSGVAIPSHARVFLASFTGQITSVSTNLHAIGDKERFTQLFERGTKLTLLMGTPVMVMFVVFAKEVIALWLGRTFSLEDCHEIARCLQAMSLVDFCFYLEGSSYAILYAMNRLKFMTFTDLFLGISNITASYLILKYSGLGVWAVILPTVLLEGLARPFYLHYTARQIEYPLQHVTTRIYGPAFIVLVGTLGLAILCDHLFVLPVLLKLILSSLVVGTGYAVLLWFIGFDSRDKQDVFQLIKRKKK